MILVLPVYMRAILMAASWRRCRGGEEELGQAFGENLEQYFAELGPRLRGIERGGRSEGGC